MKSFRKLKQREYFDRVAEIFDTQLNVYNKPAGRLRIKRRIKLFLKHSQLTQGARALEIGCGTGEYSRELAKKARILLCIDISYKMLRRAKEKNSDNKNIYFIVCDAERLPFRDDIFDVVIGNSILHHLEINTVLRQIQRVVKSDGRFAFSEPNMFNPQIALQKNIGIFKKMAGDTLEEGAFFRWQIKNKLKNAGFKDVKVKPFDFIHPLCPNFFLGFINRVGQVLERLWLIKEISGSLLIEGKK